ncbi:MAG: HAMP domain-containing histidine kinase [Eubacterium sp.]|nr:HAMP domain-containing histidine kinase [Eubacterium sp.]
MIRRLIRGLSFKVFLISFIIQILSGGLICFLLYSRTPEMLYSPVDALDDLAEKLERSPRSKAGKLIDDFIEETGMDIAIYVVDDYMAGKYNEPVNTIGTRSLRSYGDIDSAMKKLDDGGMMGTYGFSPTDDDTEYIIQYFDYGEKHNLIPRALAGSYKYIVIILVLISLVSSFIYAYLFARPVKKLSKVSEKMAEMDFTVKCDDRRKDEIGDLARNLNLMSATLDQKINELENEIERVKELESQKEMFFAAASHELKTPVTVLEGNIRGMAEGIGPYADHDVYLARSLRTVKQMESLINEILTASKMQSSGEMAVSKVDMSEVLNRKLTESEDLFTIRNITVTKEIEKNLFFEGNANLTALAIGAFISNAVFYSEEGTTVNVTSCRGKENIITEIRNSGAFVYEKDLPHLFEPFYRAESSKNGKMEGSGLGLYLANLIITRQNGTAEISNTSEGVMARIILPCI